MTVKLPGKKKKRYKSMNGLRAQSQSERMSACCRGCLGFYAIVSLMTLEDGKGSIAILLADDANL